MFSCRSALCHYIYYSLVLSFVARKDCRFQENDLWRGSVDDFAFYILVFDGGVVMFLFLFSSSLLDLTLHPECFEVEQICFSCLMVYFDETDVLAFIWVFFCHFYLVLSSFNVSVRHFIDRPFSHISCLSLLFSSFSVSISFFIIPISYFLVYAGIAWWI